MVFEELGEDGLEGLTAVPLEELGVVDEGLEVVGVLDVEEPRLPL